MGFDADDYIEYFYKTDFADKLPEVDYENDGAPSYNDLTYEQLHIVENAYWKHLESQHTPDRDGW